ncbi:AMP-binding protein [Streptomyces sp. NPDC101110]|uniref:AMP-binding protein n=1 Tax=Streptomyces sp. NPDC101110 TaxID=3366104 RepID=UPI003827084A
MRFPDHSAIICEDASVSYRELWDRCMRMAAGLCRRGVRPGLQVGVLLPNGPDFVAVYYAARALGASVVAVQGMLAEPEVERVVTDSAVSLLVCPDHLHRLYRTITLCVAPYDLVRERYEADLIGEAEPDVTSPFLLSRQDILYRCLPLSQYFGRVAMHACVGAGATLVLDDGFVAETALRALTKHQCTVMTGSLPMYRPLIDTLRSAPGLRPPRLKHIYSEGLVVPKETKDELFPLLGCSVHELPMFDRNKVI